MRTLDQPSQASVRMTFAEEGDEDADIHSLESEESFTPTLSQDIDAVTTINKN